MAHKYTEFAQKQLRPEALRIWITGNDELPLEALDNLDESEMRALQQRREFFLKFLEISADEVKIIEVELSLDGKRVHAWNVFDRWTRENFPEAFFTRELPA